MKPGRGITAQEKALTFETPFLDGAQGIIAMILPLLAYTTLFSRPVIDIQKKTTTKDNSKDGQTLSTAPWCVHRRMQNAWLFSM